VEVEREHHSLDGEGLPIEASFQHRFHAVVGDGAGRQGPGAGSIEPRGRVPLAQSHQAQTRAIALFGVRR
jgi:hypothetical protein